jgi:carbamoyltransferase
MNILGIHIGHDAALALVKNGRLVKTTSLERYSRVKKDMNVDRNWFNFFLQSNGLKVEDIDYITLTTWVKELMPWMSIYSPKENRYPLTTYGTWARHTPIMNHIPGQRPEETPWGWTLPDTIHRTSLPFHSNDINDHNHFEINIRIEGVDKTFKGRFIDHHVAHAASAYYTSNIDQAAIFTADASMHHTEACSGYFLAKGTLIQKLRDPGYMFGNFYDAATEHCGIGPGVTKAGSLMGLSAYGRVKREAFTKWKEWTAPQWARNNDREEHRYIDWLFLQISGRFPYAERLRSDIVNNKPDAYQYTREWQEPYTNEESTSQEVMDVAATVQFVAERSLVQYSQDLFEETKGINGGNLCVAGGTFLNCNANYKIATETDFDQVHMFPACGDDGTAAGSALWLNHAWMGHPLQKYTPAQLAYTGIEWNDTVHQGANTGQPLDLDVLAQKLAEDKIICWYDGASENGPRALGHRSFIASPINPNMKDILNARVKFREWYRPFAPIVLKEKAQDWFVMDFESPFMLHTVPTKKPFQIPSAVHIDNTARVQTLDRSDNPKVYDLIQKFETLTGVPIVINTSLNVKGQPIVESPVNAWKLFEESDVDILVINNKMWFKDQI